MFGKTVRCHEEGGAVSNFRGEGLGLERWVALTGNNQISSGGNDVDVVRCSSEVLWGIIVNMMFYHLRAPAKPRTTVFTLAKLLFGLILNILATPDRQSPT